MAIALAAIACTPVPGPGGPGAESMVVDVAVGYDHSCALIVDGTVRCWGVNEFGQLGMPGVEYARTAQTVPGIATAVSIATGPYQTCVVLEDATARCWGINAAGQLGDGTTIDRDAPVPVAGLTDVVSIDVGPSHACAARATGHVWCWGANGRGQLGRAFTSPLELTPGPVSSDWFDATTVEVGNNFACALRATGDVACWGENTSLQLGSLADDYWQVPLDLVNVAGVIDLSVGDDHGCVVQADGAAKCWGSNYGAKVSILNTTDNPTGPIAANQPNHHVSIEAGVGHTCAVLLSGEADCWGADGRGQRGDGDSFIPPPYRQPPTSVLGLVDAVHLSAGSYHTCAVSENGLVRCWGTTDMGLIGSGYFEGSGSPVVVAGIPTATGDTTYVPDPPLTGVETLELGDSHACVIIDSGQMRCWPGVQHELGLVQPPDPGSAWASAALLSSPTDAVDVSAGRNLTCVVRASGNVGCWGINDYGQLGVDPQPYGPNPYNWSNDSSLTIAGVANATAVAASSNHACARIVDGTVRCWGRNDEGQLGDGSTYGLSPTPVTVSSITDATDIDAGEYHACVILADETVACWGRNDDGQLGDGTTVDASAPVVVPGLTNVVEIALGPTFSCARTGDGSVHCWGRGQHLDLGATGLVLSPTLVPSLPAATGLDANAGGVCATHADGTASCWGVGMHTTLATADTGLPMPVPVTDAVAVQAGSRVCVLHADSDVTCVGRRNVAFGNADINLPTYGEYPVLMRG